jgi:hypothetical protein
MSRRTTLSPPASLRQLETALAPLRAEVTSHHLYGRLETLEQVQRFAEQHVFAVFDFMSLLKALQLQLTCVSVPWVPRARPKLARFVNEVVLGEETDDCPYTGGFISHYELYLVAMRAMGASTDTVERYVGLLEAGRPLPAALAEAGVERSAAEFTLVTWELIAQGDLAELVSAFTFSREEIIPDMFAGVLRLLPSHPTELEPFVYYLERHVVLDADDHGPLALGAVEALCGDDPARWARAEAAARKGLLARLALWDAIGESLPPARVVTAAGLPRR